MADAREQNVPGHAPIDPIFEDRGQVGPGSGDARSVKVDMGQGLPPVRRPPARSGSGSVAVVVVSAALALVCGGAGAWAYERYLAQSRAEKAAGARRRRPRIRSFPRAWLTWMVVSRASPTNATTFPTGTSNFKPGWRRRPNRHPLPTWRRSRRRSPGSTSSRSRLRRWGRSSTTCLSNSCSMRRRSRSSTGSWTRSARKCPPCTLAPADRSREGSSPGADRSSTGEGAPPSSEKGESSADAALESGASQFRERRYGEAYATFRRILPSHRDDARFWYYAALSYGLSTKDWGKMTQSMAEEGVSREKAGQPQKSAIDSAFAGLTKETGKDWLDFFRRRAR